MVLACHVGVLVGFATVFIYSFSLMVKPLQQEFGWNRQQISEAFSLAAISVAFCSPFMGKLFDRFEPRKIIALFMACFGAGVASLAWLTPHLVQFYITAVFIGVAGSGTYQLGYARVVAGWFEQRLGMALSIVVAGSGVGSFFVPPLVQHLIASYGWRHTYLILAALPLLIGVPLTLRFARSSPTRLSHGQEKKAGNIHASGATWREGLASRSFWLLVLGVCCISLSENGALAHLAPMLNDRGIKPAAAALIISILGASSLGGRLLLGWLLDYLEGSHIATFSMLAAGGGNFSARPRAILSRGRACCSHRGTRNGLRTRSHPIRAQALLRNALLLHAVRCGLQRVRCLRRNRSTAARISLRQNRIVHRDTFDLFVHHCHCSIRHVAIAGVSLLRTYPDRIIWAERRAHFEGPIFSHPRNRSIL